MERKMNQIIFGNCIEMMPALDDNSVDAVITDPPYNISKEDIVLKSKKKGVRDTVIKQNFGSWDKRERDEFLQFTYKWYAECARILKPRGNFISFFNKEDISILTWYGLSLGIEYRDIVVWHKTNPMGNRFKGPKFVSASEFFFWGAKKKAKNETLKFNRMYAQQHNIIQSQIINIKEKEKISGNVHPCQKPSKLIGIIMDIFTKPKDLILDPFSGSGTISYVASKMGRGYLAFEEDPMWHEMSKKRLGQQTLF
jgi:modification methylase